MIRKLKYPKQYLLSRDRLTIKSIPLNKHQLYFIHQQFRGQEMKARNKLNFKTGLQQINLIYMTQLRKSLNDIGQANKNRHSTKDSTQKEPKERH